MLPALHTVLWIPKHAALLKLLHTLVAALAGYVVVPAALPLIVVVPPTTTVTPPPPATPPLTPSRAEVHAA